MEVTEYLKGVHCIKLGSVQCNKADGYVTSVSFETSTRAWFVTISAEMVTLKINSIMGIHEFEEQTTHEVLDLLDKIIGGKYG